MTRLFKRLPGLRVACRTARLTTGPVRSAFLVAMRQIRTSPEQELYLVEATEKLAGGSGFTRSVETTQTKTIQNQLYATSRARPRGVTAAL